MFFETYSLCRDFQKKTTIPTLTDICLTAVAKQLSVQECELSRHFPKSTGLITGEPECVKESEFVRNTLVYSEFITEEELDLPTAEEPVNVSSEKAKYNGYSKEYIERIFNLSDLFRFCQMYMENDITEDIPDELIWGIQGKLDLLEAPENYGYKHILTGIVLMTSAKPLFTPVMRSLLEDSFEYWKVFKNYKLPFLNSLNLTNTKLKPEPALKILDSIDYSNFPNIKSLQVAYFHYTNCSFILERVTDNLQKIILLGPCEKGEPLFDNISFSSFHNLTQLVLDSNPIRDGRFATLRGLPLVLLAVHNCRNLVREPWDSFAELSHIQELYLDGLFCGGNCGKSLGYLKELKILSMNDLSFPEEEPSIHIQLSNKLNVLELGELGERLFFYDCLNVDEEPATKISLKHLIVGYWVDVKNILKYCDESVENLVVIWGGHIVNNLDQYKAEKRELSTVLSKQKQLKNLFICDVHRIFDFDNENDISGREMLDRFVDEISLPTVNIVFSEDYHTMKTQITKMFQ